MPDLGWVAAKDLQEGMHLQTKDESWLDIDKVEKHSESTTVYNFEVQGFHTYFVSELGLLVHNTYKNKEDYSHGLNPSIDASTSNPALQRNQWHPAVVENRSDEWARLAKDIESRAPQTSLPIPQAIDPIIQKQIDHLYPGVSSKNPIGNGSTAAAVRHEILTGTDVFGKPLSAYKLEGHITKAEQAITNLSNRLTQNLHPSDRQIIQNEINSLRDALNTTRNN